MTPVAAASQFLTSCPPGTKLLVAISGGSDSTGLMLALRQAVVLSERTDVKLHAATIDHDLRSGSAEEALAVGALCASLNIPHSIEVWAGTKPKTGIPAAARVARYELLAKLAVEVGATCIVTGHTLNDQQETIHMRAERSAPDATGLSGMAPATLFERHVWVVRPFLSVAREAIRDYLLDAGLSWVDDPTNENTDFERARVRKELAADPLKMHVKGRGDTRAVQAGEIAAILEQSCQIISQSVAVVDRVSLAGHPHALKALAYLVAVMGGRSHLPSSDQLARLEPFLGRQDDGSLTLGRTVVTFRKDRIYVCRENRDLPHVIIPDGETRNWDGRFHIENHSGNPVTVSSCVLSTAAAAAVFADLPPFVANRARKCMPCIRATADGAVSHGQGIFGGHHPDIKVDVVFPLFDHFLPIFDLPVANCISVLFGRPTFSPFPLHYI